MFGIVDDGTIIGLANAKSDAKFINQKIKERIGPMPQIDLKIGCAEDRELLILHVHGGEVAKTEHSHPLGMVVSTHFRCGKGVKRGLKNGALPFTID